MKEQAEAIVQRLWTERDARNKERDALKAELADARARLADKSDALRVLDKSVSELARTAHDLRRRLADAQRIVDAINTGECNAGCDSFGHDDDCPAAHPIAALVGQVADKERALVEYRTRLNDVEGELDQEIAKNIVAQNDQDELWAMHERRVGERNDALDDLDASREDQHVGCEADLVEARATIEKLRANYERALVALRTRDETIETLQDTCAHYEQRLRDGEAKEPTADVPETESGPVTKFYCGRCLAQVTERGDHIDYVKEQAAKEPPK